MEPVFFWRRIRMERFACNLKHQARVKLFSNRLRMLLMTNEMLMAAKTKTILKQEEKIGEFCCCIR